MHATMQARAKINLHLHITGRAENGYHHLDSLVAFTSLYDDLTITPSTAFKFDIIGNDQLSAICAEDDNLITRAAYTLAAHIGVAPHVHIALTKKIPLAGGLGGGSADAAAALRLLKDIWNIPSNEPLETVAASLGSDIVACLHDQPVIMRGTGNIIIPAPSLPPLYAVLVNPNVSCSTPEVYKIYAQANRAFSKDILFPDHFESARQLTEFLNHTTHNDLTDAAITVAPIIKTVLNELNALPDCLLARLSGSGATCFAVFETDENAQKNCALIKANHPDWWAQAVRI